MKKRGSNDKGQFSIIAASLVAVVLVTALITTYSLVRNSPFQTPPQVLDAVNEINSSLKNTLAFTIGYYGSILQVSGNLTYAQVLTTNYLSSGLAYIAQAYPEFSPTFAYNWSGTSIKWFNPVSYSFGNLSVTYSLSSLGTDNIHYSTSSELNVAINWANTSQTRISVTEENGLPVLTLTPQNFNFYSYNNASLAWTSVHPASAAAFTNGTYVVNIPTGVDYNAYIVQVTDPRGVMVIASRLSHYDYALTWNSALYSALKNDVIVVEALQNGSLRWIGQNLKLTTGGRPLPPIPVKAFHINQTINGVNREVPFQVEDWGSNYRVPLGISSNASVFSSQNMLVFLINHNVTNVRIWWDGRDTAKQTAYATTDRYFKQDNSGNGTLRNGILTLRITNFAVNSTVGTSSVSAQFMRVNNDQPAYGAAPAYVIANGIVRDIVQQEAEWSNGITNCPNLYSQLVIMLPANATYYTYALRTIFVNSSQSRTISDLSPIQLSISCSKSKWVSGWGQTLAENGTNGSRYPIAQGISNTTGLFYNFTSATTGWAHHWSEFVKNITSGGVGGGGVMFTNASNFKLYAFDNIANAKTGVLSVTDSSKSGNQNIEMEVDPVERSSASFQYPLDLTWYGAVVTFYGTTPIYYPSSPNLGLWIIVENPPTVALS